MNANKFKEVLQEQFAQCFDTLEKKAKEYSQENDRLGHFKTSAAEQDISPKQALWGMASKHFTSLNKMCKSDQMIMEDMWNEKITDALNYLLLLRALVTEEVNADE